MVCCNCECDIDILENSYEIHTGDSICESCFDDEYRRCDRCENIYPNDDIIGVICVSCSNDMGRRGLVSATRICDEKTTKYQGMTKGDIIKSDRTFGVEIEVLGDKNSVTKDIDGSFGIINDGSIRGRGFEIVSPVLKKRKGEEELIKVCEVLKKAEMGVNDSCGLHVHFGAKDFKCFSPKLVNLIDRESWDIEDSEAKYVISFELLEELKIKDYEDTENILNKISSNNMGLNYHKLDDKCKSGSLIQINKKSKKTMFKKNEYVLVTFNNKGKLNKLKSLFAFYIACEPVLFATQPNSRRENNSYTQSISERWNIPTIDNLFTIEDLEKYWYQKKSRNEVINSKNDRYSDSRYFSFNFHSLFCNSRNTLEIRLHAGTINAKKILNWVNINQTIMDRITKNEINFSHAKQLNKIFLLRDKINYFFKIMKLDEKVEKYFKERIKEFTG